MRIAGILLFLFSWPVLAAVPGRFFHCSVADTSEFGSFHTNPVSMTISPLGSYSSQIQFDFEDHQKTAFSASLYSDLTPAGFERFKWSEGSRTLTLIQTEKRDAGGVFANYEYEHDGYVARGALVCPVWAAANDASESLR